MFGGWLSGFPYGHPFTHATEEFFELCAGENNAGEVDEGEPIAG
jgi:hypothetical protein